MYRSGDYGRGLPAGKLEFLGRRDSQVKISGFRIEIGEIENRLLKLPGVREGAVVVTEGADQNKHLVAFCSGDGDPNPGVLRDQLAKELPSYMVPSAIHWQKKLPLTENGKIDRKALLALAGELERGSVTRSSQLDVPDQRQRHEAPSTATERRLAAAWAEVLSIALDQIGRRDHFFRVGRHVVVRPEAGNRPGPCGLLEGPQRSPDSGRSGHAGGRQDRTAASNSPGTVAFIY